LSTAAEGGLEPVPADRFRGAYPHQLSSYALLSLSAFRARGARLPVTRSQYGNNPGELQTPAYNRLVIRQLGNRRRRPAGRVQTVTSKHRHPGFGKCPTHIVVCCGVLLGYPGHAVSTARICPAESLFRYPTDTPPRLPSTCLVLCRAAKLRCAPAHPARSGARFL
jgi:hypothetical protein